MVGSKVSSGTGLAMASPTAKEALKLYKKLHRTAQTVFRGDARALSASRDKIRAEFTKNKSVAKESAVLELVKHGHECDQVLRKSVVRAVMRKPQEGPSISGSVKGGPVYRVEVTESMLVDNVAFRNDVTDEEYRAANRRGRQRSICKGSKDETVDK